VTTTIEPTRDLRAPLTRDRILATAIALADESGLDALSMRRLAQELGVEAMSLYYHVRNKGDLLAAIVDIVVAEIDLEPAGDWKAAIRRLAISAHEVLLRHPWAANLMLASTDVLPGRLQYMEALLARLREAGFSAVQTHHAYHALDSHIMGFTLWVAGILAAAPDLDATGSAFLERLPRDQYPYLSEHVDGHLSGANAGGEGEFAFGLDLILDGLERMLARG
jgi:AcrR family transcriptional regulator